MQSVDLTHFDCIVRWFYPLGHSGMNLARPFTLPFRTPPHASTPSRCSCQRFKKDKQSPKLFSSDNNMDPGSVPAELQGLTQTCLLYTSPSPRD